MSFLRQVFFEVSSLLGCYVIFLSFGLSVPFRRQEKTIMKLIVDAETDKVLGAGMCGPDAAEIMQVYKSCYSVMQEHIMLHIMFFRP